MSAHTPGPWRHNETWGLIMHGKSEVAAVHSSNSADARLIAAAPELLAALRAIIARYEGDFDSTELMAFGPLSNQKSLDMRDIALTAIAKATEKESGQ